MCYLDRTFLMLLTLVCRLLDGKVTLVHRWLWPALVRVAQRFEPAELERVREVHTPSGRHVSEAVAFPLWVPSIVHEQAASLSERQALDALGPAATIARTGGKRLATRRQRKA